MKIFLRTISIVLTGILFLCTPVTAKSKKKDTTAESEKTEDPSVKESWKKFGKDTAEAAKSFGKAVGTTGKKIGQDIEQAVNTNYYGTWVFTSGKTTTTIICKDDKSMQITQKTGLDTDYWYGTCTGTVSLIVFHITESGHKSALTSKDVKDDKTWRLVYSIDEDKGTMKVTCSAIPTAADGHNFSDATIFTLKK